MRPRRGAPATGASPQPAGLTPEELRERRRTLGLTQAELGEALGVTANTVARWERGALARIIYEQRPHPYSSPAGRGNASLAVNNPG
jgi:DNA-binding XRE family transcriptional regulator